jgi:hypothetical protein
MNRNEENSSVAKEVKEIEHHQVMRSLRLFWNR